MHSPLPRGRYIKQPRKTRALFKWLANVTGITSVWIEGIDPQGQPIWALAKRLSRTCWYLVSQRLKATAAIAALGGTLLLPTSSLHAQNGIDLDQLTGVNGFNLHGVDVGDGSGKAVASGDINGDGIDDVIIGANYGDAHLNGRDNAGETYVVFGKPAIFADTLELSSLDGSTGFIIHGVDGGTGPFNGDRSGRAVASGDINGDGIDDVIIGAYLADPNGRDNAGETYVVFGTSTGFTPVLELSSLDSSTGFVIHGIDEGSNGTFSGERSGSAVGSGDINGDGYDDVIIGAPFKLGVDRIGRELYNGGATYVVFGFDNTVDAIDTIELSSLDGSSTGFTFSTGTAYAYFGRAVSSGDINGDGIDDLIIGAPGYDYYETYVVFGTSTAFADTIGHTSLDGSNGFTLKGIKWNDDTGSAVASGDINGDGKDDVIIGAYRADPNGSQSGETYVVFGFDDTTTDIVELSSLDGSNGFVLHGIDVNDKSGISVASGDINKDGLNDIIIGAHFAAPDGNWSGETYVVFGKSTAFSSTVELSSLDGSTGFAFNGIGSNSQSGWAVASGDINGDGKDDVIIGAHFANAGGETGDKVGEVYVFTQFPVAATLTGQEGFRMLAAPASGTILDEFLGRLWTQGAIGTDGPQGDPNVWVWDENANTATDSVGNWVAVTDLSGQHMVRGEGFLMHVFADDDPLTAGVQGDFPKKLNTINIFNSAVVDTGTVTPVTNLEHGRFFLVGNPYPFAIDWDLASVTKFNLSNSIYIYDDEAKFWQSWNGTSGNITEGRISPFQSFFVQALGGSGTLNIGEEARTDFSDTFLKQLPTREARILSIQAEAGDKKTEAWLSFQEGGELQRDIYDAMYLQPLTSQFLKLGTIISSGEVLQINALPVDQQEELVIPLDLSATIEATHARLGFTGLEAFEGWEFSLRDTHTGEEFPISSTSLELEIKPIRAKARASLLPTPMPMKAKSGGSRYQLVITPAISTHNESDPGIPLTTELLQNYPNPFNPVTTINYSISVQTRVRLEVFDMLGRKVAELLNRPMQPGRYSVRFDASTLSSGVYIYRLQTGSKNLIQKMTLIK